ncbi:ABC-type antimicrobial peptide transport system permease subunit [Chitinophaga sp. W3I9]|uniref:ABC transporter permease n=1 Tax=unclassified Chitinophaga TaxID=2619133 RepID=UPI003D19E77E
MEHNNQYDELLVRYLFNEETAEEKVFVENWLNASEENQPNISYADLAPKIKGMLVKHSPKYFAQTKADLFLEPLKDWHLFSEYRNGVATGGLIDYVKMFAIIGILILVIACINFTNLSIARSEKRAREVGIRKAIGSRRKDLILQFLTESMTLTVVAFLLSLLIVILALPAFNNLTHATISIPYTNGLFWLTMAGYVLFTGLLSGSRPAFYLSSFNPVKVLKGSIQTGKGSNLPRKVLVVVQFTCSITLIISTIIIYQAYHYLQNWLMKYEYRIIISPMAFVLAAAAAIFITVFTVSFQAIKAAIANPVKSLRSE